MPFVSCVTCDGTAVCRGKAKETKPEMARSAKQIGQTAEAVQCLIVYAESLAECPIKNYKNLHS